MFVFDTAGIDKEYPYSISRNNATESVRVARVLPEPVINGQFNALRYQYCQRTGIYITACLNYCEMLTSPTAEPPQIPAHISAVPSDNGQQNAASVAEVLATLHSVVQAVNGLSNSSDANVEKVVSAVKMLMSKYSNQNP